MKVSGEIKRDEPSSLPAGREEDLFYAMMRGQTVSEEIETSRGKFTVKYPKQKDLMYIDRRVAAMRRGLPASSFDDRATFDMQKIAYLDTVVTGGPSWFEGVRNDKDRASPWSWEEVPDTEFIDEVYVKAWTFRVEVQGKLKVHEGQAGGGAAVKADVQPPVGDGLFSGVAGSAGGN